MRIMANNKNNGRRSHDEKFADDAGVGGLIKEYILMLVTGAVNKQNSELIV